MICIYIYICMYVYKDALSSLYLLLYLSDPRMLFDVYVRYVSINVCFMMCLQCLCLSDVCLLMCLVCLLCCGAVGRIVAGETGVDGVPSGAPGVGGRGFSESWLLLLLSLLLLLLLLLLPIIVIVIITIKVLLLLSY